MTEERPDEIPQTRRHPRWQWAVIVGAVVGAFGAAVWKLLPVILLVVDPTHGDPARDILLNSECGWTVDESGGGSLRARLDIDYMPDCLMKSKRGWWDGDCTKPYEATLARIAASVPPISMDEISAMAEDPESRFGPPWTYEKDNHDLTARLTELLGIGPLWDELKRSALDVRILAVVPEGERCRQTLIFDHPLTGPFRVELRTPRRQARFGALVAIHGHGDTPEKMLEEYFRNDFFRNDVVIAAPSVRTFDSGRDELGVSEKFVLAGTGLLIPHTVEQWLVVEYLRTLHYVDAGRVGIFGHSGGSDIAVLTAALRGDIRAVSIDHVSEAIPRFRTQRASVPVYFEAASLPRLWAFRAIPRHFCENHGRIYSLGASPRASTVVSCFPYGYLQAEKTLTLFWEAQIGG